MFKKKNIIIIFLSALFLIGSSIVFLKKYSVSFMIARKSTEVFVDKKRIIFPVHKPIDRTSFIKTIDLTKNALEIGPYHSPVLKGNGVKYFDVLSKEDLIKQFKIDPTLNSSRDKTYKNIPDIDFVEPHGNMDIIKEKFDIIFSSHNIEHQVDLIKHLQQVEALLNKGGKFYLFIPDKRYCFDHYIPESNISNVLAVHYLKEKTHNLQTILSSRCESTHNISYRHWLGDHGITAGEVDVHCYENAYKEFMQANGSYLDSHKWRFTPQNFSKIVHALRNLGYINLEIEVVYDTIKKSHEFQAVLQKKH